jgi:hypothetical protein
MGRARAGGRGGSARRLAATRRAIPATIVSPAPQQPGVTTTASTRLGPAHAVATPDPRPATLTSPSVRMARRSISRSLAPRAAEPSTSRERSGLKLQPNGSPASGTRRPPRGRNVSGSTRTRPSEPCQLTPYRAGAGSVLPPADRVSAPSGAAASIPANARSPAARSERVMSSLRAPPGSRSGPPQRVSNGIQVRAWPRPAQRVGNSIRQHCRCQTLRVGLASYA